MVAGKGVGQLGLELSTEVIEFSHYKSRHWFWQQEQKRNLLGGRKALYRNRKRQRTFWRESS